MSKDQREIQRKLRILKHADETGHVARTCRYFRVDRSSFYRWREARNLKECVADLTLESRLLKKSMLADGGDVVTIRSRDTANLSKYLHASP